LHHILHRRCLRPVEAIHTTKAFLFFTPILSFIFQVNAAL
jgi:hypothetical protein